MFLARKEFFFFPGYININIKIYSQIAKLKIKSAKKKWFQIFEIAKIRPKKDLNKS